MTAGFRNHHRSCRWVLALLAMFSPLAQALTAGTLPDFTKMVRDYGPAVVNIATTGQEAEEAVDDAPEREGPPRKWPNLPDERNLNEFFRKFFGDPGSMGPEGPEARPAQGSGFIISADGYVISNAHVVKGAREILVTLSDRRQLKAELVGSDARSDIALLKVASDQSLPAVRLGRSEALKVGEWVLAIGSPFGFDHSVTAGIVSAKGRALPNENYVPFIQTDVAINPGNSGGPLFNLDGEVVGVNSQIFSRTGGFMGLSFAIPIDVAMNVVKQIKEKGSVSRGWLGVLIQDVTAELADSFQMNRPHGALVSKVLSDSPALKAGLKAGDVITRFNGADILLSSDLPPMVGQVPAGKRARLEVLRDGKAIALDIEIAALPEDSAELGGDAEAPAQTSATREESVLKIRVRELDKAEREALGLAFPALFVERVKSGPAAQAGLQVGDVLLQFNFRELRSFSDLADAVKNAPASGKVPVLVQRDGKPLFLALSLPAR